MRINSHIAHPGISKNRPFKRVFLLLFFIFLFYLLIQSGHIYSVDGSVRFEQAKALLRGKLYLNQHLFCTANFNGKYYPRWLPGQSILALPLVFIGKFFDSRIEDRIESFSASEFIYSLINIFVALAIVLIILFFSKYWGCKRRVTNLLVLGFVFGGFQLIYVRNTFNNMQVGLFLFLSIFLFYLYQMSKRDKLWILIGLSLGFASITRITVLPLVLIYVLYFVFLSKRKIISQKALVIFSLVFLPFLIFNIWYGFLIKKGVLLGYFPVYDLKFGINIISNFAINFFSFRCGLFLYCPITLLGIIGLLYIFKKNKTIGFLFIVTLIYYIIFTSFLPLHLHYSWGPRFLLPIIPFLIFSIGELLNRCEKKLIVPVVSFLLIIGFLVQFPSILVNYCRFYHSQTLMKDKVDITWSIKNSPIVGQWSMLHSILVIPGHKKVEMFHKDRNFRNSEEVLKHDITMNSIDLWYVYLYLYLKHK